MVRRNMKNRIGIMVLEIDIRRYKTIILNSKIRKIGQSASMNTGLRELLLINT